MSKPSNESRQRWNAAHYTQIKVSVNPDIAAAFKKTCAAAGVSMASLLSRFMAEYSYTAVVDDKPVVDPFATRKQRRSAVKAISVQLQQVTDAEERYRDNIPENLQGGIRYEAADHSVSTLYEVLELMEQIYS